MKQAVLGYEQKFFINGTQMSGVQSVNGSYAISEKPIILCILTAQKQKKSFQSQFLSAGLTETISQLVN